MMVLGKFAPLLLATACASGGALRCPEFGTPPKTITIRENLTGHALCDDRGTLVGVELTATEDAALNREDAARFSGRLLGTTAGNLLSVDPISLASARRSNRRAFYQHGMLQYLVVLADNDSEYVRVATFWRYRAITDRFSECSSLPVVPPGKEVFVLVGSNGTVYAADNRPLCDGSTMQTIMAAGPVDRSYLSPENP